MAVQQRSLLSSSSSSSSSFSSSHALLLKAVEGQLRCGRRRRGHWLGSERSDEGSDPNRAPEEDEPDSLYIFLKKKSDKTSILKPKNLPKTLNHSKNKG